MTVDDALGECKGICQRTGECTGFAFEWGVPYNCWLRTQIHLSACRSDRKLDFYVHARCGVDCLLPPSPPTPPPSPQPALVEQPQGLIDELNRRWRAGKPSNDLSEAGVMLCMLDEDEDEEQPWLRDPRKQDRLSTSIVNARHPDCFWHFFTPGFVVDERLVTVRCSYPIDIGTMWVADHGCSHGAGPTEGVYYYGPAWTLEVPPVGASCRALVGSSAIAEHLSVSCACAFTH